MSNCKSGLGYIHQIINITKYTEVYDILYDILSCDGDLIANEGYFRETTLKLGYSNEADRIITVAMDKYRIDGDEIKLNEQDYIELCNNIFNHISDQEYYGECDSGFITVADDMISTLFIYGG